MAVNVRKNVKRQVDFVFYQGFAQIEREGRSSIIRIDPKTLSTMPCPEDLANSVATCTVKKKRRAQAVDIMKGWIQRNSCFSKSQNAMTICQWSKRD